MANKGEIEEAISDLDRVFHNEKDFQIAFSRQLEGRGAGAIRSEFPVDYPTRDGEERTYLDVAYLSEGRKVGIEGDDVGLAKEAAGVVGRHEDGELTEDECMDRVGDLAVQTAVFADRRRLL